MQSKEGSLLKQNSKLKETRRSKQTRDSEHSELLNSNSKFVPVDQDNLAFNYDEKPIKPAKTTTAQT